MLKKSTNPIFNLVKPLFLCKILLLFFIYPVYGKPLKLATWNIEWLLSPQDALTYSHPRNIRLRNDKDFNELRFFISKLNADVIALQEIGSIQTLFPKDQYQFLITTDSTAQHSALAIRKGIFHSFTQWKDFTALSYVGVHHKVRSALDVTLYTQKSSLRLLVLHLKSGCSQNNLNTKKDACEILEKQSHFLAQWIRERFEEKQPFLLLGDFNRVLSQDDRFFKNLSDFPIFLPTAKQATPCWGGNYFIDGFLLPMEVKRWFIDNSLKVLTFNNKNKNDQIKLSDHCPVSISLDIP
ncbi:hypothetical protein COMNV_00971 [Commensalibacter sp. Nvir]|uniref:endonuclease/exonuclease/phosphatase family protein n=1 Tax=Commensalibacter sp. Nvir TaxID=3069817 RepID=UPI002D429B6A|nr:hypothetical protein COMNV_00971 [Commensalibacter sp. Nvir]